MGFQLEQPKWTKTFVIRIIEPIATCLLLSVTANLQLSPHLFILHAFHRQGSLFTAPASSQCLPYPFGWPWPHMAPTASLNFFSSSPPTNSLILSLFPDQKRVLISPAHLFISGSRAHLLVVPEASLSSSGGNEEGA